MKAIADYLEQRGIATVDVKLICIVKPVWEKKCDWAAPDCDAYLPCCIRIDVIHAGSPVLTFIQPQRSLAQGEDVFWNAAECPAGFDSKDFCAINDTFVEHYHDLTGHAVPFTGMRAEPGDTSALEKFELCQLNFDDLYGIWCADQAFLYALVADETDVEARDLDALQYRRFQFHVEYKNRPCTYEEFKALRESLLSRYTGLDFAEFYTWFWRSAENFADGKPVPEFATKLARVLDYWHLGSAQSIDEMLYWTSRNFNIHPMHWEMVEAFARARIAVLTSDAARKFCEPICGHFDELGGVFAEIRYIQLRDEFGAPLCIPAGFIPIRGVSGGHYQKDAESEKWALCARLADSVASASASLIEQAGGLEGCHIDFVARSCGASLVRLVRGARELNPILATLPEAILRRRIPLGVLPGVGAEGTPFELGAEITYGA